MGMNMMHSHTPAREHVHMYADKHPEDGMDGGEMMMHMPRWFTLKTDVYFMFEPLRINSVTGIALAMCVTVVLLVIYDVINFTFNLKHCREKESLVSHSVHALLKMLSVFVGYIVMLCVMTFNVWLLVSAVLGAGVAHFILRPILYTRLYTHLQSKPCNSDDAPVTYGTTRKLLYDDVIGNEETSPLNSGTCTSCCIEKNTFPLTDVSPLV